MFRPRFTLLLLVLNLIVGGTILWFNQQERSETRRQESLRRLVPADDGAFTRLSWSGPARTDSVTLEERGGKWWLPSPDSWPANRSAVEAAAGLLLQPRPLAVLEPPTGADAEAQLASWGLDKPDLTLEATTSAGRHTVSFGRLSAADGPVYARSESDGFIRVLAREPLRLLLASRTDLRDPTLLSIPAFEARALTLQFSAGQGLKVRLTPVGGGAWRFEAPLQTRADKNRVERLFQKITELRALSFLDAGAAPAGETPAIRLTLEGNNRQQTLLIFDPSKQETPAANRPTVPLVARLEEQEGYFTIPADFISELDRAVDALRDRQLLPIDPAAVRTISITMPERPAVSLQRTETGAWQVLSKGAGDAPLARPADAERVASLLETLTSAQIVRFVSDAPSATEIETFQLTRPQREVTLSTDRTAVTLQLGRPDSASGAVFARLANEPYIYATGFQLLAEVPVSAYAFRDRNLRSAVAPPGAVRLTLLSTDKEAPLLSVVPPADAATTPLGKLASALAPLRAQQFLQDSFAELLGPEGTPRPWTHKLLVEPANGDSGGYHLMLRRTGSGTWVAGAPEFSAVFELRPELSAALDAVLKG